MKSKIETYFVITTMMMPLLSVNASDVNTGGPYIAELPKDRMIQALDQLPDAQKPKNWKLAKAGLLNSQVTLSVAVGEAVATHKGGYFWSGVDSGLAGKTLSEIAEQSDQLITAGILNPNIWIMESVLRNEQAFIETLSHEAIHHIDAMTPAGKLAWTAASLGLGATSGSVLVEGLTLSSDEILKASATIGVYKVFTEYNAYSLIAESQNALRPGQISAIDDVTTSYFKPLGGQIDLELAKKSAGKLLAEFSSYYEEVAVLALLKPELAAFMKEEIHHLLSLKALGQAIEFSAASKAVLTAASKKLGKAAAKAVPILGTGLGLTIATNDAIAGNTADAAVGYFGCIPVAGPIVEIPYTIFDVTYDVGVSYIDSCDAEDAFVYELQMEFFGTPIASQVKQEAQKILQSCNNMDEELRGVFEAIANCAGETVPNSLILELAKVAFEIIERAYAQLNAEEQSGRQGSGPAVSTPSLECHLPNPGFGPKTLPTVASVDNLTD